MKFRKILILFTALDILLLIVALTPQTLAQTQPVTKSVTIKSADPITKTVTVQKSPESTAVKKSVNVQCEDCEESTVTKNVTVKPKTVVSNTVVKETVPVTKVEVKESTEVNEVCYDEVGNSGVYSFCGSDVPVAIKPVMSGTKQVVIKEGDEENENEVEEETQDDTTQETDNNDVIIEGTESEGELPESGGDSLYAIYILTLLVAAVVFYRKKFISNNKYEILS